LGLVSPLGGGHILGPVPTTFSIGDFSRATHLSIKTLRHYHGVGLLEPAAVDPATGHRRYRADQIPIAQVIRRFRALEMPLDEIRAVLAAPDIATRNELIDAHLDRLQANLTRTHEAVSSLRDLLEPAPAAPVTFEHRVIEATPAAAICEVLDVEDLPLWFEGAFGELYATLAAQHAAPEGPGGGIYANDLFAHERGEATIFVPCNAPFRPSGRVERLAIPSVELAITVHAGAHEGADRAYGALATYVTDHALGLDGPIREYYLVSSHDTPDLATWQTEIGWPIFHIGAAR
jgi:DNA-binding transcriptional MerR regulator/effector-binding domain-containing protein